MPESDDDRVALLRVPTLVPVECSVEEDSDDPGAVVLGASEQPMSCDGSQSSADDDSGDCELLQGGDNRVCAEVNPSPSVNTHLLKRLPLRPVGIPFVDCSLHGFWREGPAPSPPTSCFFASLQ